MYDTLISAPALASQLPNSDWRLLDCRASLTDPVAGIRAYQAGHLPGALHADLEKDLSGPARPNNGGRHPLPDRDALAATFRRWGINESSQSVCYDDAGGAIAGRLWWLARWMGISRVAVLDGGLQAWQASDSCPDLATGEEAPPEKGNFYPKEPLTRQISAQDILGLSTTRTYCLIDARSRQRFDGKEEPIDRKAGHIPGAICLPYDGNLDESGKFKSAADLHRRFAGSVKSCADIICYCGSGVTAAHNILALKIAGFSEPLLYPGSWSEWIEDEKRPVLPA